ncbi:NASP-related protein sim3 [Lachnellula suecica]|uniref:NASP-related protein sim3 n=1 Tax=Lachnellula suecica TaxID=602035 RepID=A0A8T9C5H4_9HELO|nr:NASP-related protein sim3 [Lachnellula suecica]
MADPVEPPVTLSEPSSAATEVFNSVKVSLADLCAKATAQYAHKNYDEAADLYARASELQAELNGEMAPENAEILFLYGRSVFKVGQSKSDVLGGQAAGEEKKKKPKTNGAKAKAKAKSESEKITEEGVAIVAEQNGAVKKEEDGDAKKPLFQFTGDENFEDSDDDEDEAGEGEGEEEEEVDDLADAFQSLDLARVLFSKRLEEPQEGEGKGKEVGDSAMTRHIKERLADTHDLLAEISLENERFPEAVSDFKASLGLKDGLFPEESEILAEAHFKLSLALEFSSNSGDLKEEEGQALRDEAVKELEAALSSTKLKLQNQEVELASSSSPDDNDITRERIAEVKEIVAEMEGRLAELKNPPIDVDGVKAALGMGSGNSMGGVLGTTLGETPEQAAARIEEAKKGANDLSGLVRRKAKATEATPEPVSTNGKRKADEEPEDSDNAKKAKVEDAPEE